MHPQEERDNYRLKKEKTRLEESVKRREGYLIKELETTMSTVESFARELKERLEDVKKGDEAEGVLQATQLDKAVWFINALENMTANLRVSNLTRHTYLLAEERERLEAIKKWTID